MTTLRSVGPEPEKPNASIVPTTPDMAERWLAKNVKNRPLKHTSIVKYARDMAAGRWQITGEAVKFDKYGNLIDGQNRLSAVVASGATVNLFVVRGLEAEAQEVMDSGIPRNAADTLHLRGVPQAKDVSPACSALMAWESGFYRHAMIQTSPKYTNSEIAQFAEQRPELAELVAFVKPVQRALPLPIGALGACAFRLAQLDADDMSEFYDRIRSLQTSGKGDPIATLLKRVSDARKVRSRSWVSTALYYQVRAWNAYRDGERLEKFQIGSDKAGWARIPEPY